MLSRKEQLKEWDRVVAMCKGTKFEGREYLCVKHEGRTTWVAYSANNPLLLPKIIRPRIFAVAIVDNTPIWLEEPFVLYQFQDIRFNDMVFTYRARDRKLIGVGRVRSTMGVPLSRMKVAIPIGNVIWGNFTLTKPNKYVEDNPMSLSYPESVDATQVGGTHYKSKAIQPWAYMEANYTKEEFVGFLRGNAHKYLDRYKDKNGIEDLKKAIHYIEKLIQVESKL